MGLQQCNTAMVIAAMATSTGVQTWRAPQVPRGREDVAIPRLPVHWGHSAVPGAEWEGGVLRTGPLPHQRTGETRASASGPPGGPDCWGDRDHPNTADPACSTEGHGGRHGGVTAVCKPGGCSFGSGDLLIWTGDIIILKWLLQSRRGWSPVFAVCCRKKVIFCCAMSWRRTRRRTVSSSSGILWTTLLRVSHPPSTHAQNDALPLPAHRLELQLGVCECRDDPGPPPPTRPRHSHPRLWPSSNDQVRRTSQLEGAGLPPGDVLHVLRQVGGAGGGVCLGGRGRGLFMGSRRQGGGGGV